MNKKSPVPGIEPLDATAARYVAQKQQDDQTTQRADTAASDEAGRTADQLVDDVSCVNAPNGSEDHQELIDDLDGTDGDNENEPRNSPGATIERNGTMPPQAVSYYAPITRIDREKREVIGVATAEVKDAYRTVIGYEASKDAFNRWRGNIREMHDPKKAVGRALEITPDDDHKRIIVRARISKGAQDTWEKVLDGTLTGFSIGGKNGVWTERLIDGEKLPYLDRYDQAELSLVDNPACPVSNIEVVRADGLASNVLAPENEVPAPAKSPESAHVERAGSRISEETRGAMHMARDHAKSAMAQTCTTCGCDECVGILKAVHTNDEPGGGLDEAIASPAAMRALVAEVVRAELGTALRDQVAPAMSRINALLAADAQRTEQPDMTRRVDELDAQLSKIYALVEKIAAQPADGGPILHGAGAAMDKHLATQSTPARSTDADIMRRAMEMGFAPPTDPNDQIRAASKLVQPIRR